MGITINPKPSTGGGTGEDKELRQQFGQHKDNDTHLKQDDKDIITKTKNNFNKWDDVYNRHLPYCTNINSWDSAVDNGYYMTAPSPTSNAPDQSSWWMGIVIKHDAAHIIQKASCVTDNREFERQSNGGVWGPWIETSPRKLFQSVASAKQEMASALGDKGQPTDVNAPFSTFAANIRAIQTGGGGVKPYLHTVNIPAKQVAKLINIPFKPRIVSVVYSSPLSGRQEYCFAIRVNPQDTNMASADSSMQEALFFMNADDNSIEVYNTTDTYIFFNFEIYP
ncbi:pyocin knob domain-containing protein [Lysinibacillus sp. NPDC047702]|uniref:pyocin knob domain-containing protein n=1 Tax=unclassified Lysinibacillus TaxID=2636778 RepID=UPI003D019D43